MRSTPIGTEDFTTRARIRDAAISSFGEHGFRQTTIRAIATAAGVSPALVIHHYGSKDGLRAACDAHVTERIDEATRKAAADLSPGGLNGQLGSKPELLYLAPYLARALREGGDFADRLFDRVVADTEAYLRAAVESGVARPTSDERTRAQLLSILSLGTQVFARYLVPAGTPHVDAMLQLSTQFMRPLMELLTFGMFSGTDYLDALDAYLAQQPVHPAGSPTNSDGTPTAGPAQ